MAVPWPVGPVPLAAPGAGGPAPRPPVLVLWDRGTIDPTHVPLPGDLATALYYTGIDSFTKKPVHVAKAMRDRKMQRALMQFFKPENGFTVREALIEAGRPDLIGDGCNCPIPPSILLRPDVLALLGHRALHQQDQKNEDPCQDGAQPKDVEKGKRRGLLLAAGPGSAASAARSRARG